MAPCLANRGIDSGLVLGVAGGVSGRLDTQGRLISGELPWPLFAKAAQFHHLRHPVLTANIRGAEDARVAWIKLRRSHVQVLTAINLLAEKLVSISTLTIVTLITRV